ncbi:MAG: hypothetical protein H7144_07635 [Burkholderiales bacterium]|nr:hypothetical protein [Phycisphaerae bacterium]
MSTLLDLEWTTARDGSRTAKVAGKWLGGCSVPRRSAEMMLRNFVPRGNVICMLMPSHAQQVPACLAKLEKSAALIVITREASDAPLFRECADLSGDEAQGRLFLAWDEASLREIFTANPGLPIPQQFVRLPITPADQSDAAIKWAQKVFSEAASAQGARAAAARNRWTKTTDHLCVAVRTDFALWQNAGATLAGVLNETTVDLSDARQSAAALVPERASISAALVTTDWARADQKELIAPRQPWIAWITRPRVPAYVPTSPHDALLLADESFMPLAIASGWPEDRLAIARWPAMMIDPLHGTDLALIADMPTLDPPELVQEYSSWRVVWEAIRRDLLDHPHKLAGDVDGYLEKSRRHFGVPSDKFPAALFSEQLIAPAYIAGIAKWLKEQGLPLSIHGRGWETGDFSKDRPQQPITTHDGLRVALSSAAGIVDPFFSSAHPVRSIQLPRLQTLGRTPQRIIQDARAILAGRAAPTPVESQLTSDLIHRFLP